MSINVEKLDGELKAAGLAIAGCDSTGRVTWPADYSPSKDELDAVDAVVAEHDPAPSAKEKLEAIAPSLQRALALRLGTGWGALDGSTQAAAQAVIDVAAGEISTILETAAPGVV